jgi:nickel/cobalt exporter
MEPVATKMTFFVALQASTILGLLHGISPCGHSWPILAPFCITAKGIGCPFECIKKTLAVLFTQFPQGFLKLLAPLPHKLIEHCSHF